MLQTISDFLLSFLKLTPQKILTGVLIVSTSFSIYKINDMSNQAVNLAAQNKIEMDTLRSMIVKDAVKHEKEKLLLIKDCYEQSQKQRDINDAKLEAARNRKK